MSHPLLKSVGDSGLYHQPRPLASAAEWRLKVWEVRDGERKLLAELPLDALRDLDPAARALPLAIECVSAGRFTRPGEAVLFGGVRFARLLDHVYAGRAIPEDLQTVRFLSLAPATCGPQGERHWTSLPLDVCRDEANGVALALTLDGAPLPYEHGGPLRLVVGPRLFFYKAVKWLDGIELVTTPIAGCRGTWEEYAGYDTLGWVENDRFEPRLRTIDRVVSEGGRSWDESTEVPPDAWCRTLAPLLAKRDLSRLIAARLHEMGCELPQDFSDFRFADGDFRAKLRGCRFSSCRFHRAFLAGGNFSLSYFTNAELSRHGEDAADLRGCDFEGAYFQNAWLQNVSMQGCTLTNTTFTKDFARPSERVRGLDVRHTVSLDDRTRDWLARSGALVG